MPRGIYIRTEQYRQNMGNAMRGKKRRKEFIDMMKQKWIDNLYSKGHPKGMLGKHHTEETKKKISEKIKNIMTEELKNNLRLFNIGKKVIVSEETRKKLSLALKGRRNPLVEGDKSPLWKHGKCYTKEYIKNMKQRRLAFERGGGKLTTSMVQLVYEDNIKKYGTLTCIYCLKPIEFGKDTLEHKIPLSRGGTNLYENLAVACRHCNSSKRYLTEKEFLEKGQGFPTA